jgi:Predicted membrane protein (DUF2207)
MEPGQARDMTPPDDLRPAQLGLVLLGRVIVGHISATVVDLAQRGLLTIAEVPSADPHDWLLTDRRGEAAARATLLPFETTLLSGLFAQQSEVRLSQIRRDIIPVLDRVRQQLIRDAVRHHRLRRWHRDRRTRGGELLLKRIQHFRRELRARAAEGDSQTMAALAPYAQIFGLGPDSAVHLGDGDAATAHPCVGETFWSQSSRFVANWVLLNVWFDPAAADRAGHRRAAKDTWSPRHDPGHHDHHRHGGGHDAGYGHYGDSGHHGGFAGHGGFSGH